MMKSQSHLCQCSVFVIAENMNSYPPPSLQRQCSNFQGQGQGQRFNYEPAEGPVHRYPITKPALSSSNAKHQSLNTAISFRVPFPATPSPTAEVEQETEETEDLQSSGRGDSLGLADHEGSTLFKPSKPLFKTL